MKVDHRTSVWLVFLLVTWCTAMSSAQSPPLAAGVPRDVAPLFRVFLKDGRSLVSYGEFARVDDRVVFSMPTTVSDDSPQLQLVNIPSDRVDWERTTNYAESVRAVRYLSTRAETDYAQLTGEVATALNDVSATSDPIKRLAIVERARKMLAEWPAAHYQYKHEEVQQMLGILDEAIADLRAATGSRSFDLSLVASASAARVESLLPAPTVQEAIEGTLVAARTTTSASERVALLSAALNTLEAEKATLPSAWLDRTREETRSAVASELELDRQYQSLSRTLLDLASSRAARADVRGVQRVLDSVAVRDAELGSVRPDVVASLVAEVEVQLDAARRLRLERDRWAIRAPEFRAYRASITTALNRLQRLVPMLEDIRALAGSGPDALGAILQGTRRVQRAMVTIEPPSELRTLHEMIASAVQLAGNAATIRREAAINGNIARAWDASSAAAGSLMLLSRARTDLRTALRPPQLSP